MHILLTLLAITALLVGLGILEAIVHRRKLRSIPIRVHVNGTRGKSSVTRLIAAGLREAGIVTCAKTTGTLPRMILPDGREFPIFRPARANVIEQVRIVSIAAANKAQALVIECMALQPFLQWLTEEKFVRATHAVITNARADHLLVMGPGEEDVAWALAGMVPRRSRLFLGERRYEKIFAQVAKDRETRLDAVSAEEIAQVTPSELAGLPYLEHAENIALALRVLDSLGVDRETALRGMGKATPDPGVLTDCELDYFGRRIVFVNGFAANDPESTERIWNQALERHAGVRRRVAIFNCRSDRPDRSLQLGRAYPRWQPADHVVLIGSGTYIFARAALAADIDATRLVHAERQSVEEIFERVIELAGPSALVMGMGNIGGPGLDLVRHFRNRSVVKEAV